MIAPDPNVAIKHGGAILLLYSFFLQWHIKGWGTIFILKRFETVMELEYFKHSRNV